MTEQANCCFYINFTIFSTRALMRDVKSIKKKFCISACKIFIATPKNHTEKTKSYYTYNDIYIYITFRRSLC